MHKSPETKHDERLQLVVATYNEMVVQYNKPKFILDNDSSSLWK